MAASHLDLGCGQRPKNPYGHPRLFGVDIRSGLKIAGVERIEAANLSSQQIAFGDNQFDSVSAYDFFEHVPRVSLDAQGHKHFPRVLKPDGMLYAITPAYPHEKAFRDPTHVNIIIAKTHRYFECPKLEVRMYTFAGALDLKRQVWPHPRGAYEPKSSPRTLLEMLDRLSGKGLHWLRELQASIETPVHAAA